MSDFVEFRHLKYIAAIAETTNISRAAEQLYIAQPPLSRQIRELEDALGLRIFLRKPDGVCMTAAGQMIAAYAQEAIRLRDEVCKLAAAVHRGEFPDLRIGFSCFVNPKLLRSLSDAYMSLFPGCRIQFSSGDPAHILRCMEEKALDGALLPLPILGEDWVIEQVASSPLVVCMKADDPLTQRSEVAPIELARNLKIFRNPESHPAAHKRLMEMLAEIGVYPNVTNLVATPTDIQWMVKAGYGLALIDNETALDPALTTRPVAGVRWTADTAFAHRSGAEHLALPILIRHLRKQRNEKPKRRPIHSAATNTKQPYLPGIAI
ncbi:MAG TPA: LysR family transcriptional regulator [Edaphobacter sp.]|nr:LysR family transcriptional regulator [Edaphobacter sp.]